MASVATDAGPSALAPQQEFGLAAEAEVRSEIWGLLCSLAPHRPGCERRSDRRYPFAQLIRLTPLSSDGRPLDADALVVAGKHISESGLGFFHPLPLPHRRMVATFEERPGRLLNLEIDVHWCRFTGLGWYESGGRFLGVWRGGEGTGPPR